MRVEYRIHLDEVDVPRFAVEAVEGIGKLFSLATLVLNVIDAKPKVEIVFHGLNPDDPERKIKAFKEVVGSSPCPHGLEYSEGESGRIAGSSCYFRWLTLSRA